MPEEVLFETERRTDCADVASTLRTVADRLETGESVTLSAGGDSVSLTPPERPTFEVKVEREGPADGPGEVSLEFEIEWHEGEEEDADGISIE